VREDPDDRYVAHDSAATNRGLGDDTNGKHDTFRWDQPHGA
jgi:hypothetical protein